MKPEVVELSCIFLGDFNPAIFHPSWLVQKGLIKETEGDNAEIKIVSNSAAAFSIESAEFEITQSRFLIKTSNESYFESLKDLTYSIFKILKETPLDALGVNHIFHFELSDEKYLEIGRTLAPFENWDGVFDDPRLLRIEMKNNSSADSVTSSRIFITSSSVLKNKGVRIGCNDHFKQPVNAEKEYLVELLMKDWNKLHTNAVDRVNLLLKNLKV